MSDLDTQGLMLKMIEQASSKNRTLEDSIRDSQEKIINTVKDSVAIKDHYGNSLLAVGNQDKVEHFTNYGFSNDSLNFPLWLALYNDSWVFRRAIDKPSQDCIRCGIDIKGEFERKDEVYRYINKAKFDLIQLLQWGALFGGSVAVMMFDSFDDEDYKKPLKETIHKLKQTKTIRYYVTDRWYGVSPSSETVTDMDDIDFGKPKSYDITFADGTSKTIYHDYIIRYEHRVAPKLIKNGQLQGWGYAEGAHIINELSRDDKLKASIQSLVDKSLIEVIKMSGMRGVFMGADNESELQLRKRLEMVNWGRNFNSLTFLDKDDEYIPHTYGGLSGLSELLENNMLLIAAALDMQGVLFGDLKSGLAVDSSALERYSETISGRCESYVRPVYDKLLKILYNMLDIQEKVEYEFNSLNMKLQKEKQVEDIRAYVELLSRLLDSGVITTRQFGEILTDYTNKGIIDFKFTEQRLNELDESLKEESEDFNVSDPFNRGGYDIH